MSRAAHSHRKAPPSASRHKVPREINRRQAAPVAPQVTPAVYTTVTLGQSIGDVEGILGQPTTKAGLGNKTVYNYSDIKVIFINGAVTGVQ